MENGRFLPQDSSFGHWIKCTQAQKYFPGNVFFIDPGFQPHLPELANKWQDLSQTWKPGGNQLIISPFGDHDKPKKEHPRLRCAEVAIMIWILFLHINGLSSAPSSIRADADSPTPWHQHRCHQHYPIQYLHIRTTEKSIWLDTPNAEQSSIIVIQSSHMSHIHTSDTMLIPCLYHAYTMLIPCLRPALDFKALEAAETKPFKSTWKQRGRGNPRQRQAGPESCTEVIQAKREDVMIVDICGYDWYDQIKVFHLWAERFLNWHKGLEIRGVSQYATMHQTSNSVMSLYDLYARIFDPSRKCLGWSWVYTHNDQPHVPPVCAQRMLGRALAPQRIQRCGLPNWTDTRRILGCQLEVLLLHEGVPDIWHTRNSARHCLHCIYMYLHGNGYFIRDLLILSVPRGYSCNFQENDVQIQKQSQLPQTRQGSSRSSGIAGRLLGSRCRHLQHGKRIGSPVAYCYSYFSAMIRHESILGLIALQMWFKIPCQEIFWCIRIQTGQHCNITPASDTSDCKHLSNSTSLQEITAAQKCSTDPSFKKTGHEPLQNIQQHCLQSIWAQQSKSATSSITPSYSVSTKPDVVIESSLHGSKPWVRIRIAGNWMLILPFMWRNTWFELECDHLAWILRTPLPSPSPTFTAGEWFSKRCLSGNSTETLGSSVQWKLSHACFERMLKILSHPRSRQRVSAWDPDEQRVLACRPSGTWQNSWAT